MAKEAVKNSPKIEIREPKMYKAVSYNTSDAADE